MQHLLIGLIVHKKLARCHVATMVVELLAAPPQPLSGISEIFASLTKNIQYHLRISQLLAVQSHLHMHGDF